MNACQAQGQGEAYEDYQRFFNAELFFAWGDEGEIVLLNRWGKVLSGRIP